MYGMDISTESDKHRVISDGLLGWRAIRTAYCNYKIVNHWLDLSDDWMDECEQTRKFNMDFYNKTNRLKSK